MMEADKRDFYAKAAKGLAASARLYNVDAVVHVEDTDDIWFWQQCLSQYRTGHYKFMRATTNEKGTSTTGCTQCLKYKDFLSRRFFICIDSDLRYLSGEDLRAEKGILQTYTYSWENHCAFAGKLQQAFDEVEGRKPFDFRSFLEGYSRIVYEPFLLMLHQERENHSRFKRGDFHRCVSLQYRQGDELGNGAAFLKRLQENLAAETVDMAAQYGFDVGVERGRYEALGLRETNAYLYVRGHDLYNALVSIGKKLCENTGVDFEQNVMRSALAFGQYDEITRIRTDIGKLQELPL